MEKIASFLVNHLKLNVGLYVSRIDTFGGETITTFDLRLTKPNVEPVMNTAEMHTIEHLGATFMRNHQVFKDKVVYFGPMGCRTGFYLLLHGKYSSNEVLPFVKEVFDFIRKFEGDIPGATARDCGNCLDQNLPMAKYLADKYYNLLDFAGEENLIYPK